MDITAKKRLLAETASTLPGIVFMFHLRPGGKVESELVGDQFERIIGPKPDGGSYFEYLTSLILPEHRDKFLCSMKNAIDTADEWRYVGKLKKPRGDVIWLAGHAAVVRKEDGALFTGILHDITRSQKVQEFLREERKIFVDGPVTILKWKNAAGWPVDYISSDAFGYSAEDFLSGRIAYRDILHPDDVERIKEEVARFSEGRISRFVHQPYRVIQKGGSVIWLEDHTTVIRDTTGAITHYLGYVINVTEKEEALIKLKESEQRFRAIAEHTYNWENWMGPDKRTIWTNPAVLRLTGYTRDEYMAMPDAPINLIDEADRQKIIEARDAALGGQTPNDIEFRLHCKDGTVKWEAVSYQPIYDDEGKSLGYRTSVRDITDHKAAEERLIKSEARFRSYFELPLVGRAVTSPDGAWIEVNDCLCDMLGYPREELLRRTWPELTHPDDIAVEMESIKRLLTGETDNYSMDKRFIRKDGAIIWTRLMAGCVRGPAKKVEYLVAVVQNINDRMQMEQELKAHRDHLARMVVERTEELEQEINRRREKEEQYLALIESVKEWIWEINTNNVITFVSPRIYDILGYRPEELLGKTPFDTMPPEERDRVFPSFLRGMLNKEAFTSVEVQCLHKDGRMVYMEVNGRPFFDKDGNFLGYRGSANDITERKNFLGLMQENERTLMNKSMMLEETNTALRVLLKQIEEGRKEIENTFISNIKRLVLPHIQKALKRHMDDSIRNSLQIALMNLDEIVSPFLNRIERLDFTPKEIEVASHIRDGRSTKEIAEIMGIVPSSVGSHRDNIRKKLGLSNKRVNLRTYLLSMNK